MSAAHARTARPFARILSTPALFTLALLATAALPAVLLADESRARAAIASARADSASASAAAPLVTAQSNAAPVAAHAKTTARPSATDTLMLSLDEAVRLAVANGPDVGLAYARLEQARGQVREATSAALPQINATAGYTRRFDSIFRGLATDTIFGDLFRNSSFAAVHTWNLELTGTQVLFSPRVWGALRAARSFERSNMAQRLQTEEDVKLSVRRAYLDATYRTELVAIAGEGLAQARAYERDVELREKQGQRAEYDLLQARVDARNAEPTLVGARNAQAAALNELRRQLQISPARPLRLTSELSYSDGRVPIAVLESLGDPARAATRAADANVELRRRAVGVEAGAGWPTLSATGTISHQAFPTDPWPNRDQFARNVEAGAKIEFPLFLGGRVFGAVHRARAELRQAEIERDRTQQSVAIEVAEARDEVERALASLAARRGTVQLATRAHELSRIRYSNGLSTQLEVSDARLRMLQSRANEAEALRDYRGALAGLEHALGRPLATHDISIEALPRLIEETK